MTHFGRIYSSTKEREQCTRKRSQCQQKAVVVVVVVVVVDICYLQHVMISYRKDDIKKEALERNHTGVIFLFT